MTALDSPATTSSPVTKARAAELTSLIRGFPVAGPSFLRPRTYARLLTAGLRILRRTPRA